VATETWSRLWYAARFADAAV